MIEITAWINLFLQKLEGTFGERVWFVGLQGSNRKKRHRYGCNS